MKFQTPYEQLGGEETIQNLVEAFYPKVFHHPDLIPIFNGDMNDIMRKQKMFLTQFLGGPTLYSKEYGPPAMKERHMAFEITPTRAKAWLTCMKEAMDEINLNGAIRDEFYNRLTYIATIMVNTVDEKS